MGSPKGFPKGFDFSGCVEITLVLRDFQVLTGRIKGFEHDRKAFFDCDHKSDDKGKYDGKDKDKHDDKCCKPPKVDVNVEIEEECKFILLELTRPAAAVNLSSIECDLLPGVGITVSGTTFPEGACVVVNLDNVIYAGPGANFCDFPFFIGIGPNGGVTLTAKNNPS